MFCSSDHNNGEGALSPLWGQCQVPPSRSPCLPPKLHTALIAVTSFPFPSVIYTDLSWLNLNFSGGGFEPPCGVSARCLPRGLPVCRRSCTLPSCYHLLSVPFCDIYRSLLYGIFYEDYHITPSRESFCWISGKLPPYLM